MTHLLEINDLSFSWPGTSKPLLEIDSFRITAGEKVFLQGPSGSGKSTLLNLIGGVLTPQSGSIKILGTDLCQLKTASRDRFRGDHMGFIFQMFNLLPYFSALENVTIPCEFSTVKTQRIIENSSTLSAEANRLLTGLKLDTEVLARTSVTQLSVGQQQRVATARALMGKPEIIIADEPTSALDSNIRDSFIALLFEECRNAGTTLIFVSHDESLGKHFDKHISLKEINKATPSAQQEQEIII